MKGPYPSLKEVAARAGVSFQTASKFLNGGQVRVFLRPLPSALPLPARGWAIRPTPSPAAWSSGPAPPSGIVAGDLTDLALSEFVMGAGQSALDRVGHAVLVGTLVGDTDDGSEVVNMLIEQPG